MRQAPHSFVCVFVLQLAFIAVSTLLCVRMGDFYELAHFETGSYVRNSTYLSDGDYGRALDCLVKGCADVLLQDSTTGQVLIVKRIVQPQPDWWFVGGRIKAGETPVEAIIRNIKRETGLHLDASKIRYLCSSSFLWDQRQQAPNNNGTADVAICFTADVGPQERACIRLDMREYSESCWVEVDDVVTNDTYHPALRRAFRHIHTRTVYDQLKQAVEEGRDDATLAGLARLFFEMQRPPAPVEAAPSPSPVTAKPSSGGSVMLNPFYSMGWGAPTVKFKRAGEAQLINVGEQQPS